MFDQPGVRCHVLRQVGEEHRHVEANGLAGLVVGLLEGGIVDLALVVLLRAADQELNLLARKGKMHKNSSNENSPCVVLCCSQPLLHLLSGDCAIAILIHFLKITLLKIGNMLRQLKQTNHATISQKQVFVINLTLMAEGRLGCYTCYSFPRGHGVFKIHKWITLVLQCTLQGLNYRRHIYRAR